MIFSIDSSAVQLDCQEDAMLNPVNPVRVDTLRGQGVGVGKEVA